VVGQTGNVQRSQLSLNEGTSVVQELFGHLGVILVHPAQRDLLLEICDLADGVQLSGTLIGAVGDALQGHHLAGNALKRSLDSSTADLIGLGDVGAAGQVAGAALQGGKLDAAGLGVQIAGHHIGQIPKDKKYDELLNEINEIKKACDGRILKVIIETCLLSDDEKIKMCEIVSQSNADFIKTSTGFSTSGATFDDIKLMKEHINGKKIKAAGGIKSFSDGEKFISLGADRLGTSRLVKIMKEG